MGMTDASGKYAISTRGKPGAPAGEYDVSITKQGGTAAEASTTEVFQPSGSEPTEEDVRKLGAMQGNMADRMRNAAKANKQEKPLLPNRYALPDGSGLHASVKSSDNVIDFPLVP
jgi:hypothetical protein